MLPGERVRGWPTVSLLGLCLDVRLHGRVALAVLALLGERLLGGEDVLALVRDPGLVLVDRKRDHARAHVGVVLTAQFGALPGVDAGLRDLEPGLVGVA